MAEHVIFVPDSAEMGKFIGKGGKNKAKVEDVLKVTLLEKGLDATEMRLIVETKPNHARNVVKLILCNEVSTSVISLLSEHIKSNLVQVCGIRSSDLTSQTLPFINQESHPILSISRISQPQVAAAPAKPDHSQYSRNLSLEEIMEEACLEPVSEKLCDQLGIRNPEDFSFLTEQILKEELFPSLLSWLKPVDQIKLIKLCERQQQRKGDVIEKFAAMTDVLSVSDSCDETNQKQGQVLSSEIYNSDEDDEQEPDFIIPPVASGRENSVFVKENPSIGDLHCQQWQPFAKGPIISIKHGDLSDFHAQMEASIRMDPSCKEPSITLDVIAGPPPRYRACVLTTQEVKPLSHEKLPESHEWFRLVIQNILNKAIAVNVREVAISVSSETQRNWETFFYDSLVSRIFLQEAVDCCRRLAVNRSVEQAPTLVGIQFVGASVQTFIVELSHILRLAQSQAPFSAATHSNAELIFTGEDTNKTQESESRDAAAIQQHRLVHSHRGRGDCYDATAALQEAHAQRFKGAGIMFVRVNAGCVEVLLGVEYRPEEGRVVMVLGGKREGADRSSEDSAVREFCEETADLVPRPVVIDALKRKTTRRLWLGFGGYVLFIASADGTRGHLDNVAERYNQLYFKPFSAEADRLVWVPWNRISTAVSTQVSTKAVKINIRIGRGAGVASFRLADFIKKLSSVPQVAEAITSVAKSVAVDRDDLVARIFDDFDKTKGLLSRSDDELAKDLLGEQWHLKLKAPKLPQCSIFVDLDRTDPKFKSMLDKLPPAFSQRVVSIRSIQLATREAQFAEEQKKLAGKDCQLTEPLFHGTPERWRASAIALRGFDTSILLNGRALGNGVYTSADPSICEGYTRQAGSILWLKCLVTESTRKQPPVFVFTDPKHVIPLFIADVSASDVNEQQIVQSATQQREVDRRLQEENLRQFALKETEFKNEAIRLWKTSAQFYLKRLEDLTALALEQTRIVSDSDPISLRETVRLDSDHDSGLALWKEVVLNFDREMAQFKSRLPIYSHKGRILEAVRNHRVVILTASTGSGKSTQLPQYLLDDVLGASCTGNRRIAVLQPRRVNAIALAARVSSERNGEVGGEVGYRLGRGEAMVSDETRVEFMTHGLFVQLARDSSRLLRSYSAVILDEAHERSVEVDISLALLRNALQRVGDADYKEKENPFKVIVMSATISQEQVQTFRSHLCVSDAVTGAVLDLPGCTFPVRIVYRGDLQPDPTVIGSGGVGSILGDYATEMALDLLESTSSGHILVFMPGESSIERAMRSSLLLMKKHIEKSGGATKAAKNWYDIFGFGGDGQQGSEEEIQVDFKTLGFSVNIIVDESKDARPADSGMYKLEKSKMKIRVGFYPFHGKLMAADRDRILKPRDDRLVIFATNIAETGLTIPNIRYVIDTGLERRVTFNPDTGVSQMVTVPISQSSMNQRTGRAGRVASGVCIRLYSEETAKKLPASEAPQIQSTPMLGTALKLVSLGDDIILPDPIGPDLLEGAKNALKVLGALSECGKVTPEIGEPLLKLGLDLRLGRFLLACNKAGCVEHGVRLAAILATDGQQRLLPARAVNAKSAQRIADYLGDLMDETGDHLTLVRIMMGFEKSRHKIEWCKRRNLDLSALHEAQRAKLYVLEVLAQLRLSIQNDQEKLDSSGGWERAMLQCLCASYCDQMAVARRPGDCKQGFVRLLDEGAKSRALESVQSFAEKHGKSPGANDIGINLNTAFKDQNNAAAPLTPLASPSEVQVKLGNSSVMWTLDQLRSGNQGRSLVVFGSVMLTDGQPTIPQAQLMSFVSAKDVELGAPSWCREANFGELYKNSKRYTVEIPLPVGAGKALLANYGSCLARLRRKFPSICVLFDKTKNTVTFTASKGIIPLVKEKLDRISAEFSQEDVVINVPDQADMAKFIGKQGQAKKELEEELKQLVKDAGGEPSTLRLIVETTPSSPCNLVKLQVQGAAKAIAGVLVGRIKSSLCETCLISLPELRLADTQGMVCSLLQANPRLMQLSTAVVQKAIASRDDALLHLAHMLIWECGVSVYGGFVRDWVVCGQSATDVDALIPAGKTVATIASALKAAAGRRGLAFRSERVKGAAFAVCFGHSSFAGEIDVDLVDPSNVPISPPGVDADIDNMMIDQRGALVLKVPDAASRSLPLAKCVKHAQRRKFVFFYQLQPASSDANFIRLKKLLGKGFVCLSPVPPRLMQSLTPEQQQRIQPKPKYDRRWWAGEK